jgi:bacillithiol biosynthesis deacetylase BshB1
MNAELDILAFGAHPDDVELSSAGTIIHHVNKGYKVGIVDLTMGQLGTRGSAELRLQEAEKAAEIMGLSARENLGFEDGFFRNDPEHMIPIIRMIRKYRPKLVICNAVSDRHPDHKRASELVKESCFYSGLKKIETDLIGQNQTEYRPARVLTYIQDHYHNPDIVVDITPYFDKKMESIMAFSSQFYNPESKEKDTPISSKAFVEFLASRSREYGRLIGVEYGEGFMTDKALKSSDLLELV